MTKRDDTESWDELEGWTSRGEPFVSYGGWQVSIASPRPVRARKQYVCCECGKTIRRGERHAWVYGLWDDTWITQRTCVACRGTKL